MLFPYLKKKLWAAVAAPLLMGMFSTAAYASLDDNFFSATGKLALSVDGGGSTGSTYTIDVLKPSGAATVRQAFLLAAADPDKTIATGDVMLNGTGITWGAHTVSNNIGIKYHSYRADVTNLVKPLLDAAAPGTHPVVIEEKNTYAVDGSVLAVVFDDPAQTQDTSVILVFGSAATVGDTFSLHLGTPIDPAAPDALADFGLGISYSFQENKTQQYSTVKVNGQLLTSSAGGSDDGSMHSDGSLITVGGLGDSNDNPVDPDARPSNARSDDELYSILPFITAATTALDVYTLNPSNDDNIFFAYFHMTGTAVLYNEILLSPVNVERTVGQQHTATASVVDSDGNPQANISVEFIVVSGPNAGITATALTDANGIATMAYKGVGGAGQDVIQSSFVDGGKTVKSNDASIIWVAAGSGSGAAGLSQTSLITTGASLDNGDVYVWGFRGSAQQGNGKMVVASNEAPAKVDTLSNVKTLTGGAYHLIALDGNGDIYGWGQSGYGETGCAPTKSIYVETPCKVLENGVQIAAGEYFSIALDKDGQVWTWGHNLYGQLGTGVKGTKYNTRTPQAVDLQGETARLIGAAYEGAFAVTEEGHVWAWGDNEASGLGIKGSNYGVQQIIPTPTHIANLDAYAKDITYIAGGNGWGEALLKDGTVIGWGLHAALGQNTTKTHNSSPEPIQIMTDVKQLFARYVGSFALDTSGKLYTWGQTGGSAFKMIYGETPTLRTPTGTVTAIGGGKEHLLYKNDEGKVFGIGYNDLHKLDQSKCCAPTINWPGKEITLQ